MAPTLPVPGTARMVLMKDVMRGLVTASRCLTSQGGRVVATIPVFFVFSTRVSCSRTLSGGSAESRNSIASESP